jgi:hypothetical protein
VSKFQAGQRRILRERADRLIKLIELNAPQSILDMAAGTLIRGVIGAVGPGAFAAVAKTMIGHEKETRDICPFCPEEQPIIKDLAPSGRSWGMCDACLASALKDEAEAAAGEKADA